MITFRSFSSTSIQLRSMHLDFSSDNPCNTILFHNGVPMYRVKTAEDTKKNTVTKVFVERKGKTCVLAEWRWREILPDVLVMPPSDEEEAGDMREKGRMKGKWLRRTLIPFTNTVASFKDKERRTLVWKGHGPDRPYELFIAKDQDPVPVATFQRPHSRKASSFSKKAKMLLPIGAVASDSPSPLHEHLASTACLILDPRVLEDPSTRDLIVVSFLLLEKTRRLTVNASINMDDVLGMSKERPKRKFVADI